MVLDAELLIEVLPTRLDEVLGVWYLHRASGAAGEEDQGGDEDAEDKQDKEHKSAYHKADDEFVVLECPSEGSWEGSAAITVFKEGLGDFDLVHMDYCIVSDEK